MGHLSSYCPNTVSVETRKWYHLCLGALGVGENVGQSLSSGWEVLSDIESALWEVLSLSQWHTVGRWRLELAPISVKGRLKKCLQFWESELEAPVSVLSTIERGYVLPLTESTSFYKQNQASARLNAQLIHQSVTDLLAGRCNKEIPEQPYICSPSRG